METIGSSSEGRDLNVIQISSGGSGTRPAILLTGGIHGAEWITPALSLYIVNQLVENSTNRDMVDSVDWLILPLMNPDGYEYSNKDVCTMLTLLMIYTTNSI
jgi:murein tripeptide amidase MpaA